MKNEEVAVSHLQKKYHAQEMKEIGEKRRGYKPKSAARRAVKPQATEAAREEKKEEKKEEKRELIDDPTLSYSFTRKGIVRPPRMMSLARFTSSLSGSLRDSNTGSGTGGAEIISGHTAAKEALKVMMNPFNDSALARWPDPFTLEPTSTAKDVSHHSLTIFQGADGEFDGGTGMYIRGDPVAAFAQLQSIDSSTTADPYKITWVAPSTDMATSIPVGCEARPVAIGHRFTYSGVGNYHSIIARVVELPPWGPISSFAGLPAFPTNANAGPNFYQREYFRAREVTLNPGETLTLMAYPLDARGLFFDFTIEARELESSSSWNGYVVWFFGLSNKDTLYHDAVIHHEFVMPAGWTPSPPSNVLGIYPKAVVKPDTETMDGALGTIVDVIASGANVFKTVLTKGEEIFRSFVPMLGSPANLSWVRPLSTFNVPQPAHLVAMGLQPTKTQLKHNPRLLAVKPLPVDHKTDEYIKARSSIGTTEENKSQLNPVKKNLQETVPDIEEMPVVLTPSIARRPSVARSLGARLK